ncbi:unnamed protein product, partial [Durusdinium trenchii]
MFVSAGVEASIDNIYGSSNMEIPSAYLSVGTFVSCMLFVGTETVRCWGAGSFGILGQGSTKDIGDDPDEMGDNLEPIDLGTGRTVKQVSLGRDFTCALLDDDSLKCWGYGGNGNLGQGSTEHIGDEPNEMGDNLAPIDLGPNRKVKHVVAGGLHTCVLLHDETVLCWGFARHGQLGRCCAENIGDSEHEMGYSLTAVDLGSMRTAKQITAGYMHTCALLDDHSVKCWGHGVYGQLGQGDNSHLGDDADEMGDLLEPIDFGEDRKARQLASASGYDFHSCVLLDDDSVKCWGWGNAGVLGQGSTDSIGDAMAEMGDFLHPINFGALSTVAQIDIRLFGGSSMRGRLQVLHRDSWRDVCDDNWHGADAQALAPSEGGEFTIVFPMKLLVLNAMLTCDLGSHCLVYGLQGTRLTKDDKLLAMKECGTSPATSAFVDPQPVHGSYSGLGNVTFDFGLLPLEGFASETVQLCWCSAGSTCSDPEDFRTPAMQLDVTCPPGTYELVGRTRRCHVCPPGYFCPGGVSFMAQLKQCPYGSTSSRSSSSLQACECRRGHFLDVETGSCLPCLIGSYKDAVGPFMCQACPLHTTTVSAGAIAISECMCASDWFDVQPAPDVFDCTMQSRLPQRYVSNDTFVGFASTQRQVYSFNGSISVEGLSLEDLRGALEAYLGEHGLLTKRASFELHTAAEEATDSWVNYEVMSSEEESAAELSAMFEPWPFAAWAFQSSSSLATAVMLNPSSVREQLLECPEGMAFAPGSLASGLADCQCPHGMMPSGSGSSLSTGCVKCPLSFYKASVGDSPCTSCSIGMETLQEGGCVIIRLFLLSRLCCPGVPSTSLAKGEGALFHGIYRLCFCMPNPHEDCAGAGSFKAPVGLLTARGPFDQLSECEVDSNCSVKLTGIGLEMNDLLVVTSSCETVLSLSGLVVGSLHLDNSLRAHIGCSRYSGLRCPGHFELAGLHAQPRAQEGWFQTGNTTAVQCLVELPNGASACRGSAQCENGTHCFVNKCVDGSTGMLCGECPENYARSKYLQLCKMCPDSDSGLTMAMMVLADLGRITSLNFAMALLAAQGAGNALKLDSPMIRVVQSWKDACSILLSFNLNRLLPLSSARADTECEECDEQHQQRFQWPMEITAAMDFVLSLVSLVPEVNVDFAIQCHAEALLPGSMAAKRLAPALYYLFLPILSALSTTLLCAFVVYVVVPLAKLKGIHFNDADKETAKRAKYIRKVVKRAHERPRPENAELVFANVLSEILAKNIKDAKQQEVEKRLQDSEVEEILKHVAVKVAEQRDSDVEELLKERAVEAWKSREEGGSVGGLGAAGLVHPNWSSVQVLAGRIDGNWWYDALWRYEVNLRFEALKCASFGGLGHD